MVAPAALGNVLAIIPARGGSKGILRKNIMPIAGKPLIAWSIETALEAGDRFYRTIVSTDDEEIADTARAYGADVPFMRPAELALDTTPTVPVLQHSVEAIELNDNITIDWIMLLQPTAPFRRLKDIDAMLDIASKSPGCDAVISVVDSASEHPMLARRIEGGYLRTYLDDSPDFVRRQDCQPPAYFNSGSLYLTKRHTLMEQNAMQGDAALPYVMDRKYAVDIDDQFDARIAEILLRERLEAIDDK